MMVVVVDAARRRARVVVRLEVTTRGKATGWGRARAARRNECTTARCMVGSVVCAGVRKSGRDY